MNLVKKIIMVLVLVVSTNVLLNADNLALRCVDDTQKVKYFNFLAGWAGPKSIEIKEIHKGEYPTTIYSNKNHGDFIMFSFNTKKLQYDFIYNPGAEEYSLILSKNPNTGWVKMFQCEGISQITLLNETL